jgi:hypothetical protein
MTSPAIPLGALDGRIGFCIAADAEPAGDVLDALAELLAEAGDQAAATEGNGDE